MYPELEAATDRSPPRHALHVGDPRGDGVAFGAQAGCVTGPVHGKLIPADPQAGPAEQGSCRGLAAADRGGDLGAAEALAGKEECRPGARIEVREPTDERGPALALEVAGLGGHNRSVRRRDAMRARVVDRLEGRHHRFHGDETLCHSWR